MESNLIIDIKPEIKNIYSKKNTIPFEKLTYGSKRKVLWECNKNHTWESRVSHVFNGHNNCPICHIEKKLFTIKKS